MNNYIYLPAASYLLRLQTVYQTIDQHMHVIITIYPIQFDHIYRFSRVLYLISSTRTYNYIWDEYSYMLAGNNSK